MNTNVCYEQIIIITLLTLLRNFRLYGIMFYDYMSALCLVIIVTTATLLRYSQSYGSFY
jgi:hypothetical protein